MKIIDNTIYSDEGKILRRISDKMIAGTEYSLGYTYYIGGEKLNTPHLEVPEDFEEITEDDIKNEKMPLYPPLVEKYIREKYTISDELAIQRQRETKPEAFQEYFEFCEECKKRAREELGL